MRHGMKDIKSPGYWNHNFGCAEVGDFVVEALTVERFSDMRERVKDTRKSIKSEGHGQIRLGSICTGWGTAEMVSENFCGIWNETFPDYPCDAARPYYLVRYIFFLTLTVQHVNISGTQYFWLGLIIPKVVTSFMCEKQADRQKLLTFRYTHPGHQYLRTTPIFTDMNDLRKGFGMDYISERQVAVPEACVSCVSFWVKPSVVESLTYSYLKSSIRLAFGGFGVCLRCELFWTCAHRWTCCWLATRVFAYLPWTTILDRSRKLKVKRARDTFQSWTMLKNTDPQ